MKYAGALAVVIAALLVVPAVAQDRPQKQPAPEVLQSDGRIDIGEGDVKVLRFAEPFKIARTPIEGVIEVIPQNDRTIAITALKPGRTVLFLQNDDGRNIYTASVTVSPNDVSAPAEGHAVKFYDRKTRAYTSYWCNDTGCGRSNSDLRGVTRGQDTTEQSSTTVTEVHQ